MNISIDYQSRIPIYEQIVLEIERQVILEVLKPNEQIPSIRDLACMLGVNPNTVKKSYDILEQKGVIISKSTKGTFIAEDTINAKNEKISSLFDDMINIIKELEHFGFTKEEIFKKLNK